MPPKKKKATKKVTKKKVAKRTTKKKVVKRKVSTKDKPMHELIKMIRHTQEHLDYVNDEVAKNALEIQKLITHMAFLDHNLVETRKMLEFLVNNLPPKSNDSLHTTFDVKKATSELARKRKEKEDIEKEKEEKKKFAMHDNITIKCKNCKAIGLITQENCKECGAKI